MIAPKILTMKIEIETMSSGNCPELVYSIEGSVSEQGCSFGFGRPLSKQDFTKENINKIIERTCQPKTRGIIEKVKIVPKIVVDCRANQLMLF